MRDTRFGIGLLAAFLLAATPALAQELACGVDDDGDGTGDDCFVTKYGFGHPDDRDYRVPFEDQFTYSAADFEGSFIMIRSDQGSATATSCGIERSFSPYQGQVLIREQNPEICTPTAEFPTCNGGTRDGQECRLLGLTDNPAAPQGTPRGDFLDGTVDCPGGGTCDPTGGCPFEIPMDLPGIENDSAFASGLRNASAFLELMSATSPSFSATSPEEDADGNVCLEENKRAHPAQGYRFVLPASRGGGNGETYLRFHGDPERGLYRHDDDGAFCCTSPSQTICGVISEGFDEYPDIYTRNCSVPGRYFRIPQTNDWLFDADPANPPFGRFVTDPEHVVQGQRQGLCRENRLYPCELGGVDPCDDDTCNLDTGLCENLKVGVGLPVPCASNADCDLNDVCDVREPGFRNNRPVNQDTDGDLIPDMPTPDCNSAATFLHATPNRYCAMISQYAVVGAAGDPSGDPGPDCGVWNFAARPLVDDDCNGVDDRTENGGLGDFCPFLNEYDYFADSDGDCTDGDPDTICRGDECECGDQTEDGMVNIEDILGQNAVIFGLQTPTRIGDATNDLTININDILRTNGDIFGVASSTCRQVTRLACGDGAFQLGEACDDGNLDNLDGCDTACQVELGWACTSPTGLCGGTATACTLPENCDGIGDGTCVYDTPSVCGLIP